MAITIDDFSKIWASTSPLTPYEFSESNYKEGWNFIGGTPPSRQMWDFLQKQNDEKLEYLLNNFDDYAQKTDLDDYAKKTDLDDYAKKTDLNDYLPLAGGALTGDVLGVTPPNGDNSKKLATTAYVQEEIRQHGNLPVGHEYFSMNPNIPQGSLPLIGGVYSRDTYADLWAWVQTQSGYLKTEAEWQTLSTANNGNVPYYSSGDGSTTFRVPSLKCWIKGTDGVETVGTYLDAGLPNITGSVDSEYIISNNYSGAFSYTDVSSSRYGSAATEWHNSISFDASKSNSIYGNANTVVPESIVGMWLVKAYGTVVDTGTIDEQAYIDDRLATKLNITGGNLIGNLTINGKNVVTEQAVDISSQASFSVTSSNATVQSKTVYKTGSIIWCTVGVKTTASISVGGSVNLSFSGIPAPVIGTTNASYFNSTGMVIATFPASTVAIRVISGTGIVSGETLIFSFSYPTA